MYNTNLISFKRMTISDLEYMHKWLNYDYVIEWYSKKKWTFKEVEDKYIPYINNEKPTQSYLIMYNYTPIGYIQTYKIHDYPDYAKYVDIDENSSGLDLFIGEYEYIHKGLGKYIISKFIKEIIFTLNDSISCIIGPEPKNKVAIRTYENVGFKYIKTIQIDDEDEPEYIMRVTKNEIIPLESKPQGIWYHGSNKIFKILEEGSTITQWKKLAEEFSHKPTTLAIDDNNLIFHNGKEYGYLYIVDESIEIDVDIYAHPNTTMGKDLEFLTKRKLKTKMIADIGLPTEEYQKLSEEKLKKWLYNKTK